MDHIVKRFHEPIIAGIPRARGRKLYLLHPALGQVYSISCLPASEHETPRRLRRYWRDEGATGWAVVARAILYDIGGERCARRYGPDFAEKLRAGQVEALTKAAAQEWVAWKEGASHVTGE